MSAYKIAYVPWWRPIMLMQRNEGMGNGFKHIGWLWRVKARQVKNINYGWIAFVEDQTEEKLQECPCCRKPLVEQAGE